MKPSNAQRPVLITGCSGQVGGELRRVLSRTYAVVAPARKQLDLADSRSIRRVVQEIRPRWIINSAAYTAVDRAESEPDAAFAINGTAPGILGEEALKVGAAVLHLSTDYVFSGKGTRPYVEADETGPLNVYGASKLVGEHALATSGAPHLILRSSWIYARSGKNFLHTVLRVAAELPQMRIVNDQCGAPTSAGELARLVKMILAQAPDADAARSLQGIYHATASGETTWFGFAGEILRRRRLLEPEAGFAELVPVPTSAYPTAAVRPHNSRLDCAKVARTFGFRFRRWDQALAEVIESIPVAAPIHASK